MSWRDMPRTVTPEQQNKLDSLEVTVNIPVYNEDALLLDRALYSLFSQTRLPNCVQVVDDGSASDYTALRRHWELHHPPQVNFFLDPARKPRKAARPGAHVPR